MALPWDAVKPRNHSCLSSLCRQSNWDASELAFSITLLGNGERQRWREGGRGGCFEASFSGLPGRSGLFRGEMASSEDVLGELSQARMAQLVMTGMSSSDLHEYTLCKKTGSWVGRYMTFHSCNVKRSSQKKADNCFYWQGLGSAVAEEMQSC